MSDHDDFSILLHSEDLDYTELRVFRWRGREVIGQLFYHEVEVACMSGDPLPNAEPGVKLTLEIEQAGAPVRMIMVSR